MSERRPPGRHPRRVRELGGPVRVLGCGAFSVFVLASSSGRLEAADHVYLPDGTEEISLLSLSPLQGWAEILFQHRRERAEEFELRESLLAPELHLATQGSIYHEELLAFRVNGSLALQRQRVRGGERRSQELAFSDYEASARVLDHKKVNLLLHARNDEAWVDSPFRGSYEIRSSGEGVEVHAQSVLLPAQVSYHHERRREDFPDVERTEEHHRVRLGVGHRGRLSQTELSLRLVDSRHRFPDQDFRTVSASLNNTLHRTADSRSHLRSGLQYFNQYGTIRRRDFTFSEEAVLVWRRTLQNTASYRFTEQTGSAAAGASGNRELIRSQRVQLGGRHTLYGSLSSSLDMHASRRELFDRVSGRRRRLGRDRVHGARAGLDYRRRTPIGRLNLGFGYEVARQDQSSQERTREVANESHILEDGNEPRLEKGRIDLSSIVVTDETGFILYEADIDYTVAEIGGRVVIFRVPSGSIENGQTVLVDYRFEYSPDLTFDTVGRGFHFRFDASRIVSVYYRYNRYREDFVSGIPNGYLEDQRTHVAGIRLHWGSLSASEEYEVQHLLASAFRTNRLSAGFDRRLGWSTRLNMHGSHSRSHFDEAGRTLRVLTMNFRLTSTPRKGLTLGLEGWLRRDRGSPEESVPDADESGVRVRLTREFRSISVTTGAFYRVSDRNDIDEERGNFFLTLRRTFRTGGGARQ